MKLVRIGTLLLLILIFSVQPILAKSIIEDIWQEKVEVGEILLNESPDNIRLRFLLTVAYANLGKLEAAMEELQVLGELDGGKMTRQLIKEYEAVRKAEPQDLLNLNYLAFAYVANSQYAESKLIFEEILDLDPESVWSLNYYALVLGNLEEFNLALQALKKANSIEENKYTHFIYSLVYFKQGKMVKGMWHFSKSGNVGLKLIN